LQEVWKDIQDYEGLYQVSNLGRIKSLPRNGTINSNRILKQFIKNSGYCCVILSKNNMTVCKTVHRMVAQAFLNNPNCYPVINHKDENKLNNNVNNLEWCTQKYNINYGVCREKMSKNHSHKGRKGKPINQFDKDMNLINTFKSITEAGEKLKINYKNICMCCKGQRKTAGNYIWEYAILKKGRMIKK
jgi:hypothetical protein